jgi:hypothetical protein
LSPAERLGSARGSVVTDDDGAIARYPDSIAIGNSAREDAETLKGSGDGWIRESENRR